MKKQLLALVMVLSLLVSMSTPLARAEEYATLIRSDGTKGAFPALNEEGFLDEGEFVYADAEEGLWRFVDENVRVEIFRCQTVKPDPKLIWYEAEIWSRNGEIFQLMTNLPDKHMSSAAWPHLVARKHQAVFAINTDFAQNRYPAKKKVGVIIRDRKIFIEKTVSAGYKGFPNLDILALFEDGSMKTFESNAHTGQEYLDMGVVSTLAFGPILIQDGVINEAEILARYNGSNAPRTAIGMIEPGHYAAVMVEGRTSTSTGCKVIFAAQVLKAMGCVEALNLDGGETACMIFMGEQINTVGKSHSKKGYARKTTEVLGIGESELVPSAEE
ncbi:MAG: phosphodiester glycosidase family protein [Aristaeellaceae bacterium]